MSADEGFVTTPVMHVMRAMVQETTDFLIAPTQGSMIAVGAGPDPENPRAGLLYIGMQANDGRLLTAIIPEEHLPFLATMLSTAADQVKRLDFESSTQGAA